MKVYPLSNEEILAHGASHKVVLTFADLTDTAGLTKTIAIFPVGGTSPIGTMVRFCKARVKTAFAGTTTLTAQVGDDGDTDRNLAASNMMATAGTWYSSPTTVNAAFAAANTVDVLFTATVDNLSALTAGEVELYLKIERNDRLAA